MKIKITMSNNSEYIVDVQYYETLEEFVTALVVGQSKFIQLDDIRTVLFVDQIVSIEEYI